MGYLLIIVAVAAATLYLKRTIMAGIEKLTTEVTEATSVMESASTLIRGLKEQLDEAIRKLEEGDNGEALDALSAQLDTSANSLAEAVQANTPGQGQGPTDPTQPGQPQEPGQPEQPQQP